MGMKCLSASVSSLLSCSCVSRHPLALLFVISCCCHSCLLFVSRIISCFCLSSCFSCPLCHSSLMIIPVVSSSVLSLAHFLSWSRCLFVSSCLSHINISEVTCLLMSSWSFPLVVLCCFFLTIVIFIRPSLSSHVVLRVLSLC